MKNKRKFIWYFILGIVVYISILLVFSYIKYSTLSIQGFLNITSEIGVFANTVLQGLFLTITLYIAKLVEKNEQTRHYNQFKYQAYTELCGIFHEINFDITSFNKLRSQLGLFNSHNNFLFNQQEYLDQLINELQVTIADFTKILKDEESQGINKYYLGDIEDSLLEKIVKEKGKTKAELYCKDLQEFYSKKEELFEFVQKELYNSNPKKGNQR